MCILLESSLDEEREDGLGFQIGEASREAFDF